MRNVRTRKSDPNFLPIDPKQDLTDALYDKASIFAGDFSIFCVVSTNETKTFEIGSFLKGSEMSRVVTFICSEGFFFPKS